jgi:bifunctional ADP-heptose synthase (sugar kinase/adenylyltransferase)
MSEGDLRQSLENIKSPRILVVGDLMLDYYSWGKVDRISPEAPIPVMQVLREDRR